MRRPIVTANFKMHMTASEVAGYVVLLRAALDGGEESDDVESVIAPPFTALDRAARDLDGSRVKLAAQDVSARPDGAYTGDISTRMLAELGCAYAIVGHSERRAWHGETDADVREKATALLEGGLLPIVCVGESLAEREAGRMLAVVESQLRGSLPALPAERAHELVIAYEPIWAIGTGRTATPELAQQVHQAIRGELARQFGKAAQQIRIQYGGSVNLGNAAALMAQPDIDGALVGGASLDPASFAGIVRRAAAPA
jgi:triosephosphate isomerase